MKTEIMQKIIEKQDELIKMISPHGAEFWGSDSDKYLRLTNDIVSLKSQLAEEKEEDVYTKSLRLLTEFMDKTPSEEIAVELRKIAEKAGEEKKDYSHLCCICHENYVDSDNGYDTCDSCMNRV